MPRPFRISASYNNRQMGWGEMNLRNARCASMVTCALATAGAAIGVADARAQENVLPPVVVEGATIEVPPKTPAKTKKKSSPPQSAQQVATGGEAAANASGESTSTGEAQAPEATASDAVSGVRRNEIGSAVTVVTRAQLKEQQIRNAAEALRSLPGVSVSTQGGRQNLTVVRIRGAESNQTLVVIDGVEVNAGSDGFFDFSNLLVDDIAQIEVIRGPQSGLYSSGAIGGVINIVTTGGKGPLTFRARAEAGSFGTNDGMVAVSGGTDKAHGSLVVTGLEKNGFNIAPEGYEEDGGQINTVSFTGGILIFENLKLDTTLRRSQRDGDRDGFEGIDPVTGLSVASDDPSTFASTLFVGRMAATLDTFKDGRWTQQVYLQGTETENSDLSLGSFDPPKGTQSQNLSTMSEYGYLSTYRLDGPSDLAVQHVITGLAVHRRETFEQPLTSTYAYERDRDSLAAEARGQYFNVLNLIGNVRHDFNEGFQDATTWRVTASLQPLNSSFRFHSSYGTGVKYPSFSEQFGEFFGFQPNPNLVPEESQGWDAGVETTLFNGAAVVDVTYFDTTLKNEIDFDYSGGSCGGAVFCYVPFNRTGKSTRNGIEVEARALLSKGLTVGLSYTYLNATEDDGQEEIRRPPHSGRMDVNYNFLDNKANLNIAAIYNGETLDLGFDPVLFSSALVTLDEYWLVNVAASYQLSPGVELFGRIENALNQDYQEIFGFETADLAVYGGLRFTYVEEATRAWAEGR
jgi:vitamin B12 transporter